MTTIADDRAKTAALDAILDRLTCPNAGFATPSSWGNGWDLPTAPDDDDCIPTGTLSMTWDDNVLKVTLFDAHFVVLSSASFNNPDPTSVAAFVDAMLGA